MCTNRLLLVASNIDNTNLNGNVGVSHNLFNAAKTTGVRLNSDYDRVGASMKENNPQLNSQIGLLRIHNEVYILGQGTSC